MESTHIKKYGYTVMSQPRHLCNVSFQAPIGNKIQNKNTYIKPENSLKESLWNNLLFLVLIS